MLLTRSEFGRSVLALDAVRRFSAVATPAVALLVLTGAASAVILTGSTWALASSLWGRLLILKVAIVAAMCVLAASNRWRVTSELARDPKAGARRLRRNAVTELALGIVVLAVVAVLGTLRPTA